MYSSAKVAYHWFSTGAVFVRFSTENFQFC